MTEEQFIKKYCKWCGSQRCEGPGTEWFDGCGYAHILDNTFDFNSGGHEIVGTNGSKAMRKEAARIEANKPCPFRQTSPRCLCHDCESNAIYNSCTHGYCINCFECIYEGNAVHDIYICTGYKLRKE